MTAQDEATGPAFDAIARTALLAHRRQDRVGPGEMEIPRLVHSLRLIGGIRPRPKRVCDLATFGHLAPAMKQLFQIGEITATGIPDDSAENELVFHDAAGVARHQFVFDRFDIELAFPYADESFDLVVFTEVLEHLTRDPMHTMSEINRITRMGGWLLLSTPNCVSLRSCLNVLRGEHPYIWSPYCREGHRDRHNREYTPAEVSLLVRAAGFEIRDLHCRTVYETSKGWARQTVKHLLAGGLELSRRLLAGGTRLGWTGDTIFAVAQKISAPTERFPSGLYY